MRWAAEAEAPGLGAGIGTLAVAQETDGLGRAGRGEVLIRRGRHPARAARGVHPHDAARGGKRPRAHEAQEREHEACEVEALGGGVTHLES